MHFLTKSQEVNNMFSDKDLLDIFKLSALLQQLIKYLSVDREVGETNYAYLTKSINVLHTKDIKGIKNISNNLMMDFRMMIDRGLVGGEFDIITNSIYEIIDSNPIFRK